MLRSLVTTALLVLPILLAGCRTATPVVDPHLPPINPGAMTLTGTLDASWRASPNAQIRLEGSRKGMGGGDTVGTVTLQPNGRFTAILEERPLHLVAAQPSFGSLCEGTGVSDVKRSGTVDLNRVRTTWLNFSVLKDQATQPEHVYIRLTPNELSRAQHLVYAVGEGSIHLAESCLTNDPTTYTDTRYTVDIDFTPGWNLIDINGYRSKPNWWNLEYRKLPLPVELNLK